MKAILILLAGWSAAACQTTPNWDSQFGNSTRAAIASQTLHPGAAANPDPVAGVDSAAALGAQKRYEHSFAQPEPKAASFLINTVGQ